MKVFADYHTHTRYSHGKGTIEDNVKAAIARGLTQIGITDHGPASYSLHRLGVKNPEKLLDIKAEINRLQRHYPQIEILAGVEANVISIDGTIDVPYKILQKLDKILVGLHLMIIPKSFSDGKRLIYDNIIRYKFHKHDREEIRYYNTLALLNALKRYPIDIITHPGYRLDIDTVELARACKKAKTALEINVSHGYLTEEFVKTAAKEGVKFVISSDAHRPEDVGRLSVGIDLVKRIGLPKEQVLNLQ
ncbi:histidinol-phosphatase [Anoxybacter fermentans]|uniref:Histidinol-phosphatase n=1 Tax=Anoxybacter fermentans TaxID=1323375 RepID=A0A3Q9HNV9_9FIRM|nr:PHP domain-containing protein [Anoxybacter fermentans]AZR72272.1 histidinol-phosphatase [Anoxybacter fermentans]